MNVVRKNHTHTLTIMNFDRSILQLFDYFYIDKRLQLSGNIQIKN